MTRTGRLRLAAMLLALLLPAGRAGAATLCKGPYLVSPGRSTSMIVLWQADETPRRCSIEWGATPSYGAASGALRQRGRRAGQHQFRYTIRGLKPGTLYYYRVKVDSTEAAGSFRTAPPSDATSVTFYGFGDTRTYPEDMNRVVGALLSDVHADTAVRQTFLLHVGDWAEWDSETSWQDGFFNRSYADSLQMMAELPIMGCRGNHEDDGVFFRKYWPYSSRFYYSFDYGPVHVAVIDQYVPYEPGSAEYVWLEKDLAASKKPFKIALFHEPAYSAGGAHANNDKTQEHLCPLFERYGVQVAVAGHNHFYAHCLKDGIHHITAGTAGAPIYLPADGFEELVAAEGVHHFVRFSVSGDVMTVTAIRADGTVIESFDIKRR